MNSENPIILTMSILFAAAMIHGFFLSILVYRKRGRIQRLLACIIALLSIWIFNYLIYTTGWINTWPHLMGICIPFLYLVGPLLLYLSKTVVEESRGKWAVVHSIPFVLILVLYLPEYFQSATQKLEMINHIFSPEKITVFNFIWNQKLTIFTLAYSLWAWQTLRASGSNHPFYVPLKKILFLLSCLFLIKLTLPSLLHILGYQAVFTELLIILLIAIMVHTMGYFYFNSINMDLSAVFEKRTQSINSKYQTSPLDTEEIKQFVERITDLFQTRKPWLDSGYSMETLAAELQIPKHHLSQVINEGLSMNFYELVNKYRIAEVIERLTQGEYSEYSISGIGADCGFNSPSTFHRAFKKNTGMTPTNFIKALKSPTLDKSNSEQG